MTNATTAATAAEIQAEIERLEAEIDRLEDEKWNRPDEKVTRGINKLIDSIWLCRENDCKNDDKCGTYEAKEELRAVIAAAFIPREEHERVEKNLRDTINAGIAYMKQLEQKIAEQTAEHERLLEEARASAYEEGLHAMVPPPFPRRTLSASWMNGWMFMAMRRGTNTTRFFTVSQPPTPPAPPCATSC